MTNIEKIKAMSTEELAKYLLDLGGYSIQTMLDHHYCTKCKQESGGKCPMTENDCRYGYDDEKLLIGWLEAEVEQ